MGSLKPTPPEDQESVPLAKNHPYARMSYADTIKRVISEKVQMNYIVNKYKEAMSKDLIVKKPVNRPEINVSRLKTRIDQNGKSNGLSRQGPNNELNTSLNIRNLSSSKYQNQNKDLLSPISLGRHSKSKRSHSNNKRISTYSNPDEIHDPFDSASSAAHSNNHSGGSSSRNLYSAYRGRQPPQLNKYVQGKLSGASSASGSK